MAQMNIRPFRYTDLEALIEIAKLSFAQEYTARGETPDSFARQIRLITRGRMIPFRVLSTLAGIKWELFVAEVDGHVVGCGGYAGRQQMELSNLMVHPHYRRQGVGQALLEKRLQNLAKSGYPFVITTVLASNHASLGNVSKQGFEVFDQYSFWESPLPLHNEPLATAVSLECRPVQSADVAVFKTMEVQMASPVWLQIQGSMASTYFPSFAERLLTRFSNSQRWTRAFIRGETTVGFLTATTSSSQAKGILARPVMADENLDCLPAMLAEATTWLTEMGKTAVQIAVPDEREQMVTQLEASGWVKRQSWLRLMKWLK